MRKIHVFGAFVAGASVLGATVGGPAVGGEALSGATPALTTGRSLSNSPYLSSTGQTVPHPGALSDGQSGSDRQIHDHNDLLIRKGICSNC